MFHALNALNSFSKDFIAKTIIQEQEHRIPGAICAFFDETVMHEGDWNGRLEFADGSVIGMFMNGFEPEEIYLEAVPGVTEK